MTDDQPQPNRPAISPRGPYKTKKTVPDGAELTDEQRAAEEKRQKVLEYRRQRNAAIKAGTWEFRETATDEKHRKAVEKAKRHYKRKKAALQAGTYEPQKGGRPRKTGEGVDQKRQEYASQFNKRRYLAIKAGTWEARKAKEAKRDAVETVPPGVKVVTPKTKIARVVHCKRVYPDARFVRDVLERVGNGMGSNEQVNNALRRGLGGTTDGIQADTANDFLRNRGRTTRPEPTEPTKSEPTEQEKARNARRARLEGLTKAVGCKAVATVVGLIPDDARTEVQIITFLDDFAQSCPHLFESDLTDRTLNQVRDAAGRYSSE